MNPSSHQAICDAIESVWPRSRWMSVRVVVGVSGGADSLCLLRGLHQLSCGGSQNLIVAHYDHRMRTESSRDAKFVENVARQLGLPFVRETSLSESPSRSEADLRNERYVFFESTAKKWGARYVAIAHHRDDQVETILHNIFRGTGARGLRGMTTFRPLGEDFVLSRPLLNVSRHQIERALEEWNQPFQTDDTNRLSRWKRNWLRNELLPLLKTQFPHAEAAVLRLAENMDQVHVAIDQQARQLATEAVDYDGVGIRIDNRQVSRFPHASIVSMLQHCWREM
ncbi:MAG: tRNA lysidine(34) synthetase TilS, partial [Pirellulaceae bacterium]